MKSRLILLSRYLEVIGYLFLTLDFRLRLSLKLLHQVPAVCSLFTDTSRLMEPNAGVLCKSRAYNHGGVQPCPAQLEKLLKWEIESVTVSAGSEQGPSTDLGENPELTIRWDDGVVRLGYTKPDDLTLIRRASKQE